jgi:hypothetical protein
MQVSPLNGASFLSNKIVSFVRSGFCCKFVLLNQYGQPSLFAGCSDAAFLVSQWWYIISCNTLKEP